VPAGTGQTGTITVVVPAGTAPNTYYVLTCADAASAVVETNEANNCTAATTRMTVTP
jgi:hypothetical protein